MNWFPLPTFSEEIELVAPCEGWSPVRVLELLKSPNAQEWRHKVGVAGPVDGSAKTTTRLLAVEGWVCKTRVDVTHATAAEASRHANENRLRGVAGAVWHPRKLWAVFLSGGEWLELTICPELETLRQGKTFEVRSRGWTEMLQMSIEVDERSQLGLDVSPANFGVPRGERKLYYLDDEFYQVLTARNLASAIVARIPEEPHLGPSLWKAWGTQLRGRLRLGRFSWNQIAEEISLYPLPRKFADCLAALSGELTEAVHVSKMSRSTSGQLTCVLADVHANRPALEAVLDDARMRGADSFVFLGDAVGYGPHPADCIKLLAELPRAVLIRGNHDHAVGTGHLEQGMNRVARWCAEWTRSALNEEELRWLAGLPIEHVNDDWMAVHGAPRDPRKFLAYVYELTYEDNLKYLRDHHVPLCFYGHTHVQLTHVEFAAGPAKLPGRQTIKLNAKYPYLVNPGSVGQPRDGDTRAAYALWNRTTKQITTMRVPYNAQRTLEDLHALEFPSQLATRLLGGW
jgi:diadenosine tetraphosphatase ApaH/serine/threonine PP2A family protein phosphatase